MMNKKSESNERFEIVEQYGFEPGYDVVRDNVTGVLYVRHTSLSGGLTMTLLVDQKGKPLIDDKF